jgi:hypothetical protein
LPQKLRLRVRLLLQIWFNSAPIDVTNGAKP